jgi:hypothetical protein
MEYYIINGGAWSYTAASARVAYHYGIGLGDRFVNVGFRIIKYN